MTRVFEPNELPPVMDEAIPGFAQFSCVQTEKIDGITAQRIGMIIASLSECTPEIATVAWFCYLLGKFESLQ